MPQDPSFFAGDDDPQGQYLNLKDVDGDGLEVSVLVEDLKLRSLTLNLRTPLSP